MLLALSNLLCSSAQSMPGSLWDVLRSEFSLNHEVDRREVKEEIAWILRHPGYLNEVTSQSSPYLFHVINEIQKRHLPGEIALLPMIESSYNPFSESNKGAAGLWQLMPETSNDLGLKRNWWVDSRRDIAASTNAALNYLEYLHKAFRDDWAAAFASYNAGEGKVSRTMKYSHNRNYWALPLPQETKHYVPRLLALAEIIKNPWRYNVKLPYIPNTPYFKTIELDSPIDLNQAARLAGISYQKLIALNPGYNRWATAPNQPSKLTLPTTHVAEFTRRIAGIPKVYRTSLTRYQVKKGESLRTIAARYHTTTTLLKNMNQLQQSTVHTGQPLVIPSQQNGTTKTAHFVLNDKYRLLHIVDAGETLSQIARKYHVSTMQIQSWNQLPQLHRNPAIGQQLIIWR